MTLFGLGDLVCATSGPLQGRIGCISGMNLANGRSEYTVRYPESDDRAVYAADDLRLWKDSASASAALWEEKMTASKNAQQLQP